MAPEKQTELAQTRAILENARMQLNKLLVTDYIGPNANTLSNTIDNLNDPKLATRVIERLEFDFSDMPNTIKNSAIYTTLIARFALITTFQGQSEQDNFQDFVDKAYNSLSEEQQPRFQRIMNEGLNQLVPNLEEIKNELLNLLSQQQKFAINTIMNLTIKNLSTANIDKLEFDFQNIPEELATNPNYIKLITRFYLIASWQALSEQGDFSANSYNALPKGEAKDMFMEQIHTHLNNFLIDKLPMPQQD